MNKFYSILFSIFILLTVRISILLTSHLVSVPSLFHVRSFSVGSMSRYFYKYFFGHIFNIILNVINYFFHEIPLCLCKVILINRIDGLLCPKTMNQFYSTFISIFILL